MAKIRPARAIYVAPSRIFLLILLICCWFLGQFMPRYKPAVKSRVKEALKAVPKVGLDWPTTTHNPRGRFNGSKLALLIEPRPLPHLAPQILHMISVVPPDWRFLFIGSRESVFAVSRPHAIKSQQVIGKLDLMELSAPWSVESKEDVFRMMTDTRFYDEFLPGVEWILKYESDSLLCANSEVSLNDWLDWDWAGSPRTEDDRFSGNGGLSLRRVSVIKRILGFQKRFNDTEPEDEWFGKRLWVLPGARVASRLDGVLSVEDVYVERPMGYHGRGGGREMNQQVWGDAGRRKAMLEYCPELSMIMDMKLERERCPDDDGEGHRQGDRDDGDSPWEPDVDVHVGPPQPPPFPRPWAELVSLSGADEA